MDVIELTLIANGGTMDTKKKLSQDRTGLVTEAGKLGVEAMRSMLRMEAANDGTQAEGINIYKCGSGC